MAEYLTYVAAVGDNANSIEMRYINEYIWLTQKLMAALYDVDVRTTNYHLKKIYEDDELREDSVIQDFRITATDGKSYSTKHYNLQAITLYSIGGFNMSNKQFYHFIIPSIGAMVVTGLYFVVDGIFVGRGVGTLAVASINIAVPFISLLLAVTMMIVMGGATITSIHFGKGEKEKSNIAFRLSMLMVLFFSFAMTIISYFFSDDLARLLGASELLLKDTSDYIKYFIMFGVFYCSSNTLSAFVRNDGNPRLAFWGMIVGATTNVFLDWLFIFPLQMGVKGAAIASGLGQVLACLVLSTHFIFKKGELTIALPEISIQSIGQIVKTGTPEFITQMGQPVTIFCYNLIVLKIFGEIGVSAFSVISYILIIVFNVFTGLAQGIQPLISRSFGEENTEAERFFFRKGLMLNIILAATLYVIILLFGKTIISIFNNNSELIMLGFDCIKTYGICFIFAAINIVYTVYYLATKRTRQALTLSILRSFVANIVFIFLMPQLFGVKAIWTGVILAESTVCFVALLNEWLRRKNDKKIGTTE